jgi:hypothetical protein
VLPLTITDAKVSGHKKNSDIIVKKKKTNWNRTMLKLNKKNKIG